MSSDGAIDKPRSVRPARGDDRGLAGIALGALLVLALIATVVMVFSDNPVWMRIGTLSALWAAFIGAFLVARYRRQAAAEAARVRDLHTVYELQLEREISARREHELVVEKDLRDSVRAETTDSIHALRHEIAALREQLGQMGVTLTDERLAVGGDTTAGELGAGSSLPSVPSERVEPRRRAPESTLTPPVGASPSGRASATPASGSPASSGMPGSTPPASSTSSGPVRPRSSTPEPTVTGVGRDVTPSTERTEKFSPVEAAESRPTGSKDDKPRGPAVRPAGRSRSEPLSPPEPQKPEPETAREQAQKPEPETAREQAPKPDPAAAESAPHSRHGEGGGLSVAELMARLGGDDAPGRGRRHRHSAD
ncbi:DUF6779 domain-containing protein [Dietzia sp. 2505]|uniref:DUF6779 domain-containing protein n=1 Tax=Dietzia sp. 2505 TaxID=3156457 RepID=UPI00339990C9